MYNTGSSELHFHGDYQWDAHSPPSHALTSCKVKWGNSSHCLALLTLVIFAAQVSSMLSWENVRYKLLNWWETGGCMLSFKAKTTMDSFAAFYHFQLQWWLRKLLIFRLSAQTSGSCSLLFLSIAATKSGLFPNLPVFSLICCFSAAYAAWHVPEAKDG